MLPSHAAHVTVLQLLLACATGVMHTVFSTECTSYFDWCADQVQPTNFASPLLTRAQLLISRCSRCARQSVAMFYSHDQVEQPGYITRLMACDHPEGYSGLDIGPTYVHPNYGSPKNNLVQDHYAPYNKPGSLYHWLFENPSPPVSDYVLVVEPDMVFRKPVDCERDLAVRRGMAASAPYGYLDGTDNGMAAQFVGPEILGRLDKVGGFYCIAMEDLKRLVPAWLNYTKAVRKYPERYWQIDGVGTDYPTGALEHKPGRACSAAPRLSAPARVRTGDAYVERGHAPWISEMYGYIFGAGSIGLQHIVRDDVVMFAGLPPAYEPALIHYGLFCQAGQQTFNKLSYKSGFNVRSCDQYFPEPPSLDSVRGSSEMGTELVCVEQVAVLNEALCEYHRRTCCKYAPSLLAKAYPSTSQQEPQPTLSRSLAFCSVQLRGGVFRLPQSEAAPVAQDGGSVRAQLLQPRRQVLALRVRHRRTVHTQPIPPRAMWRRRVQTGRRGARLPKGAEADRMPGAVVERRAADARRGERDGRHLGLQRPAPRLRELGSAVAVRSERKLHEGQLPDELPRGWLLGQARGMQILGGREPVRDELPVHARQVPSGLPGAARTAGQGKESRTSRSS